MNGDAESLKFHRSPETLEGWTVKGGSCSWWTFARLNGAW